MVRLSHAVLSRAHRFLLELHAADSMAMLRRQIPQGLGRLIACDRAATNEFQTGGDRRVLPSPVPAYWPRYGPVMVKHADDHPLINPSVAPVMHRAMTFSDFQRTSGWRRSTLYNEYHLPVGAKQQLAVSVTNLGSVRFILNCNRWGRDFSASDRAVMELISPHVELACRNATTLERFRAGSTIEDYGESSCADTVTVDDRARVVGDPSPGARNLLRKYLGADAGAGSILPELLRAWLRAQRAELKSIAALERAPEPLHVRNEKSLVARLVQATTGGAVILLEEKGPAPSAFTNERLARDVLQLADALGVVRFVVCGHSFGGKVAMRLAALAPERVAGLVLIGAVGPGKVPLTCEAVDPILDRATDVAFVRESFRPWFSVWPRPELDRSLENFARTPGWAHRAVCEIALWTDITAELTSLSAPALLIAGEHDPVYGPAYRREAVMPVLAHAQMATIDCGHGLILERPEEIATQCERFLGGLNC